MRGEFEDDYGIRYSVSSRTWTQGRTAYAITEWHTAEQFLIARSDSGATGKPPIWVRVDWTTLRGMPPYDWAFCYSAFDVPSAEAARAVTIARRETPRTGCNGHPFSRMARRK